MMVKRILVILLSCFAVVSCKTARIKKELKEFTGQQIVLPDSLRSTVNGRDTTLTDFMGAETKLVVFYDSVVCSSCRINRMYEWKEVIATSIGLKHKFNAIFIFSPKRGTESQLITSLKAAQLDYPVFLDSGGLFLKRNPRIPSGEMYHTFLLDRQNRVVLVGNPIGNERLWELYKKEIKNIISAY